MAWATVEQVTSITTVTPSAEELAVAQGIVEMLVDRYYEDHNDRITLRDQRRLRQAVAFQAAFVHAQAAEHGSIDKALTAQRITAERFREGSRSYSTGGTGGSSSSVVGASLEGVVAPLAAAAVRRVSWMSVRTLDPLNLPPAGHDDNDDPVDGWKRL